MMKKFLAILLAMMLVLVNVAALAEDGDTGTTDSGATGGTTTEGSDSGSSDDGNSGNSGTSGGSTEETSKITPSKAKDDFVFSKEYDIITIGEKVSVPADELTFTANLVKVTNSTVTVETAPATIKEFTFSATIPHIPYTEVTDESEVTDETAVLGYFEDVIKGTIPSYPAVGIYTYELTESGNNPAGVVYSGKLYLKVIIQAVEGEDAVEFLSASIRRVPEGVDPDFNNNDNDSVDPEKQATEKVQEVTNEYASGTLTIGKTVTGNFGDKTQPFEMTVTFNSTNTVYNDIYITLDKDAKVTKIDTTEYSEDTQPTKIDFGEGWTSKTVTFELTDSDSILFENVPVTVSYTVTETAADADDYKTSVDGSDDGAQIPATATTGKDAKGSVDFDPAEGDATEKKITADTVTFTNDKGVEPDMGIELETLPFVLLMCIALVGVMALRRREDY